MSRNRNRIAAYDSEAQGRESGCEGEKEIHVGRESESQEGGIVRGFTGEGNAYWAEFCIVLECQNVSVTGRN